MPEPLATIVITTHNRKDELPRAIDSALAQNVPVEILVIDDASTDGTAQMVRERYPQIRLDRTEQNLGLIAQRTRSGHLASAPIIISIDDDAVFSTPDIVRQTLADFDDPRIGAVAIPYVDVLKDQVVHQRAPVPQGVYVASDYRGTAHALRRELFVQLGGYCDLFYRQNEESDYCIRMLHAGYYVRLGRSDPIHHFESTRRSNEKIIFYMARNNLLFAWRNAPPLALALRVTGTSFLSLLGGVRSRFPLAALKGLLDAQRQIILGRSPRRPVSQETYRRFRLLRKKSPVLL